MILVSRWFLRAYTSSPTWTMSSTKSLAFAGPRDDAARTAANCRFRSPGMTPAIRDSVHLQPCSLHAKNSTALSVRGSSAVNSTTRLHRSHATSSSRAHSKRMWRMSSSGPPQKIQGWAGEKHPQLNVASKKAVNSGTNAGTSILLHAPLDIQFQHEAQKPQSNVHRLPTAHILSLSQNQHRKNHAPRTTKTLTI